MTAGCWRGWRPQLRGWEGASFRTQPPCCWDVSLSMVNSAARTPRPGPRTAGGGGLASNQDRGSAVRMGGGHRRCRAGSGGAPPSREEDISRCLCVWRVGREGQGAVCAEPLGRAGEGGGAPGSTEQQSRTGRPAPQRPAGCLAERLARQPPALECPWKTAREARRHGTCPILEVPGIRPAAGGASKRLVQTGALKMPLALRLLCTLGAGACVCTHARTGRTRKGDRVRGPWAPAVAQKGPWSHAAKWLAHCPSNRGAVFPETSLEFPLVLFLTYLCRHCSPGGRGEFGG